MSATTLCFRNETDRRYNACVGLREIHINPDGFIGVSFVVRRY